MNMNISDNQVNYKQKIEYQIKEKLYHLFYDITGEIKGEPIQITEKEWIENINTTSLTQLLNYIKETVYILNDQIKEKKPIKTDITQEASEFLQLEQQLKKHEKTERLYLKKIMQNRLQKEALENRVDEYAEMEEEFEEMKEKLKYEEGKFWDNDRKDHEIVILRRENTNIKQMWNQWELKYKSAEEELKEQTEIIVKLRNEIKFWHDENSKSLKDLKEISKFENISSINLNNNSTTNKNIISNGNTNAHYQGISEITTSLDNNIRLFSTKNQNRNKSQSTKHSKRDITWKQKQKMDKRNPFNKGKCTSHLRNNSMNIWLDQKKIDLFSKYFTNYQKNGNCVRIKKKPLNISQSNRSNRNYQVSNNNNNENLINGNTIYSKSKLSKSNKMNIFNNNFKEGKSGYNSKTNIALIKSKKGTHEQ